MRALDRLISFIFSIIMLIISIVLILVGVGVVNPQMIIDMLNEHVFDAEMISANVFNVLTIVGISLFLASLKTTIFLSLFKTKDKSPILVKTQNGEIEIAQETITNTVRNVGLSFDNIKDVQAKMIKKRKGVAIYAMVLVYANSNIREITEEMQKQIKEVVKATTGVIVLEVNIKVKNIYQKQKKNSENAEKVSKQTISQLTVDEANNMQETFAEEIPLEKVAIEDGIESKTEEKIEEVSQEVIENQDVMAETASEIEDEKKNS